MIACGYIFAGNLIPLIKTLFDNQYRYDSVFAYVSSLCILVAFINIKIKSDWLNKAIIFIAPSILGVYLIHDHSEFSPWSWEFLNMPQYMDTLIFPVIQLAIVIAIMVLCLIIDIMRRYTIGRVETSKFVINLCENIESRAKVLLVKICG